jgi:hypothetical protein
VGGVEAGYEGVLQSEGRSTTAATSSILELSHTLIISAIGASLPIEETETSSTGVNVKIQLSKWGEIVPVLAPPVAATSPHPCSRVRERAEWNRDGARRFSETPGLVQLLADTGAHEVDMPDGPTYLIWTNVIRRSSWTWSGSPLIDSF